MISWNSSAISLQVSVSDAKGSRPVHWLKDCDKNFVLNYDN